MLNLVLNIFFKKWAIPGLFFLFNTVDSKQINFANGWIQTADLWYRKQLLYQPSHNHCPVLNIFLLDITYMMSNFDLTWGLHAQNISLFELGKIHLIWHYLLKYQSFNLVQYTWAGITSALSPDMFTPE